MLHRDLTDGEWAMIAPLLPPERGRAGRPAQDNRRFLNGMLWVARTGASWRDLPPEYGKWNTVYQRFRRWSQKGVWRRITEPTGAVPLADGGRAATVGRVAVGTKAEAFASRERTELYAA